MMEMETSSVENLNEAFLQLDEPVLLQGIINNSSKGKWKRLLELDYLLDSIGDMPLPFRVGQNAKLFKPQWDLECSIRMMTIRQFLELTSKTNSNDKTDEKWYYFDYKYMHEWFKHKPQLLKAIDWSIFGFDKSGDDTTLWIGSKGAHTNCHQDSYGCNLIAQLHGKKDWLLFPPDSGNALQQTRVPYEESTIYSKINFFCPSKNDENTVMNVSRLPKLITLKPGDFLFVPKGWWHYVESVDTSISMNVWLPVDTDNESRLKEALVKFIITRLGEGIPAADEDNEIFDSLQTSILLIKECVRRCQQTGTKRNTGESRNIYWTIDKLIEEYPTVASKIPNLSKEQLQQLLVSKRERFLSDNYPCPLDSIKPLPCSSRSVPSDFDILKSILDTICHRDVIDNIAEVLLTENN